jgi:hypothetical protein
MGGVYLQVYLLTPGGSAQGRLETLVDLLEQYVS